MFSSCAACVGADTEREIYRNQISADRIVQSLPFRLRWPRGIGRTATTEFVLARRRRGKIGRSAADPIAFRNALRFIDPFRIITGSTAVTCYEIRADAGMRSSSNFYLNARIWIGVIREFKQFDIALMRRAVDVVKHQDRDRKRAENRDDGNEDHAEVMQDRRVHLARSRVLRKADPCEEEARKRRCRLRLRISL